jgi:putative flippase GtrA
LIQHLLRYAAVGLVNSIVGLAVIYAAATFLKFGDVAANACGFAVGFALSFALNKQWTFRHEGNHLRSLVLFGLVVAVSYLLNLGVLLICTRILGMPAYLAQVAGIATYAVASFLGARYIAFGDARPLMESLRRQDESKQERVLAKPRIARKDR